MLVGAAIYFFYISFPLLVGGVFLYFWSKSDDLPIRKYGSSDTNYLHDNSEYDDDNEEKYCEPASYYQRHDDDDDDDDYYEEERRRRDEREREELYWAEQQRQHRIWTNHERAFVSAIKEDLKEGRSHSEDEFYRGLERDAQ